MALIGSLREKMGIAVVIFVFVAIAAFVMEGLFSNNSVFLNDDSVGKIGGTSISQKEYQRALEQRESMFAMQYGQQPGEAQMGSIHNLAWERLIGIHAIEKQYEKVGSVVTIEEIEDMLYGKHIDPGVLQTFSNQQGGQFDPQRVKDYLAYLIDPPDTDDESQLINWQNEKARWKNYEQEMIAGRSRIKYENLLIKSTYVTTTEAEQNYHVQSDVAEVKYIYVPFSSVSDSGVTVTDADLKAYYDKNKEKFKSEQTRNLKFVQFEVIASANDSLEFKNELDKLVEGFKTAEDDSTFAALNTDNEYTAYANYTAAQLPTYVSIDEAIGTVKGPFIDGASYKLVKLSKAGKDTVYSVRAKHILIKWATESEADKKVAKEKTRKILNDLKAGADFTVKARENSEDPTNAQSGGDLGWFRSGEMVKSFDKAVFAATKPGLINDIIETEFGYHIISVTNVKDNKTYTVATIEREITASDASIDDALRKAGEFANELEGIDDFVARAENNGITVYDANNIGVAERRLNTLPTARPVIQWLFRDAEMGEVSQVFDLQDVYVVAVMTGETEKGYLPLDAVKDEITPAVKNEVKGKNIIAKLEGLKGSLEEIAQQYGSAATVSTSSDLKLSTTTLAGAGYDPKAIGEAFSPEGGKRTKPFASERGVLLVEVQNKTIAPAIGDYTSFREQLIQAATNKNSRGIAEAIKQNSDITDTRYKFY